MSYVQEEGRDIRQGGLGIQTLLSEVCKVKFSYVNS